MIGALLLSAALIPPPPQGAQRDPLSATTLAIFKPRGVISATGPPSAEQRGRRTLTDVMIAAGVATLSGHIGRLDAETSGLILVTEDSLLLRAAQ